MPAWVQQGADEYQKRLPRQWQFKVRETAQANLATAALNKAKEAELLNALLPDKGHVVALDNRGKAWSTQDLCVQLQLWQELGKPVSLLVGGPDGLSDELVAQSDQQWSLSPLTFPHPLVRVIVVEQLYRAHSMLINHPYHRA
jgi:23S rRNA (pseudouridine1915-N3)-methyltransferase